MKIAILQSDYIPWKGYFDIIRSVDLFVVLDDVQFTRRDWRNRNVIKTKEGLKWLSIPVKVKGRYNQLIRDTEVAGSGWAERHWKTISVNYGRSPYFADYRDKIEGAYKKASVLTKLHDINMVFIKLINSYAGIKTKIVLSETFSTEGRKSERVLSICREAGADEYLTGPAGLSYLDTDEFNNNGIKIVVADYRGYPEYDQLFPPFVHNVSIIDLMFQTGCEMKNYMKLFQ